MTELKFKLKKAGRCVGVYHIIANMPGKGYFRALGQESWCPRDVNTIDFDSVHSFVRLDRTGKEVYEGDTVMLAGDERYIELRPMLREPMHEYSDIEELEFDLVEDGL